MGLGDMLGVKVRKLNLNKDYKKIEDLYAAIENLSFEGGQKPMLVKHGLNMIIVFPELDRNNQIWIIGSNGKYSVQRSTVIAGVGNMLKNMALDHITDGWSSFTAAFGGTKKACMALVDKVADTIEAAAV